MRGGSLAHDALTDASTRMFFEGRKAASAFVPRLLSWSLRMVRMETLKARRLSIAALCATALVVCACLLALAAGGLSARAATVSVDAAGAVSLSCSNEAALAGLAEGAPVKLSLEDGRYLVARVADGQVAFNAPAAGAYEVEELDASQVPDEEIGALEVNPSQQELADWFAESPSWADDELAADNAALQAVTCERLTGVLVLADFSGSAGTRSYALNVANLSGCTIEPSARVLLRQLCEGDASASELAAWEVVVDDMGYASFELPESGLYAIGESNRVSAIAIDPLTAEERAALAALGAEPDGGEPGVGDGAKAPSYSVQVPSPVSSASGAGAGDADGTGATAGTGVSGVLGAAGSELAAAGSLAANAAGTASAGTAAADGVGDGGGQEALADEAEATDDAADGALAQEAFAVDTNVGKSMSAGAADEEKSWVEQLFANDEGDVDPLKVVLSVVLAVLLIAGVVLGAVLLRRRAAVAREREVNDVARAADRAAVEAGESNPVSLAGVSSLAAAAAASKAAASHAGAAGASGR